MVVVVVVVEEEEEEVVVVRWFFDPGLLPTRPGAQNQYFLKGS